MNTRTYTAQGGYIVLTTTIIISLILLVVAISLSVSSYFNRASVNDYWSNEQSYYIAYSCADYARSRIEDNFDYSGNELVIIDSEKCRIKPITYSGLNTIIQTVASTSQEAVQITYTLNDTLDPISLVITK